MGHRKSKNTPPRLGKWLLKSFCSYDFLNTALWDLEEIYVNNRKNKPKIKSDLLYFWQVIGVIFHLYFKGKTHYTPNRVAMLKNHIIISFRNFKRNKTYTFLNVLGLTSGLIVFILITLYVSHEFSYDQYHQNKDRIYRVGTEDVNDYYLGSNKSELTPSALAPALRADFPEVTHATRLYQYKNTLIKSNNQIFLEPIVYAAHSEIFSMFSFEVVDGDLSSFLAEKNTVVLSESTADKYFGRTNVVGEVVYFRKEHPMIISGVIKDMPANSHFTMGVILQFETMMELHNLPLTWDLDDNFFTYIMLAPDADPSLFQSKLPELRAKYANDPIDEDGQSTLYYIQPLTKTHLSQGLSFEMAPTADSQQLYTYLGIAFMILIIAGINYMNLATAQAIKRTKEIGIRKVVGAKSKNLIFQFLLESFLLVSVSLLISIFCLVLVLPIFSQFVNRELALDFAEPALWLFLSTLCFGLSFLSGIYPAFILTSFQPVMALKGKGESNSRRGTFKNVLVVLQFTIAAVLILGTLVLSKQLNYIQNMEVGYVRDQVLVFNVNDQNVRKQLPVFNEELRKIPGVLKVATSGSLPNDVRPGSYIKFPGSTEKTDFRIFKLGGDYDFFDFYGFELIEGRNFSDEIESDKKGILLNESAVKALGWEDPIGMQMVTWNRTQTVIGVIKDFHQHSVHQEIKPLQIYFENYPGWISVKVEGNQLKETLEAIEVKYYDFSPEYPFEYSFFDDVFDRAYLTEIKTTKLVNWFAGLTILVACLGLYGLASYKVEQRIKEVGIRKVLGASVPKILALLSKDFIRLLVIAFIIATPIAYYVMDDWLNDFAYHTSIGVFTFIITLIMMILIAGLAVGHRTYKAAVSNPVEALRDE